MKKGLPSVRSSERVDELVVGDRRRASARHERADVAPPERAELDALDVVHALELGEVGEQGLPVADLVAPHGGDDEDRAVAEDPGEVGQEVERRAVRPLEVLDDQHERSLAGDPLQDVEHGLEQLGPRTAPGVEAVGIPEPPGPSSSGTGGPGDRDRVRAGRPVPPARRHGRARAGRRRTARTGGRRRRSAGTRR